MRFGRKQATVAYTEGCLARVTWPNADRSVLTPKTTYECVGQIGCEGVCLKLLNPEGTKRIETMINNCPQVYGIGGE